LPIDGIPLPVAVKVINEANNEHLDDWSRRWKQQAEILRTLDHPSLVKVRDTFEGPLPHPPGKADPNSRSLFLVMNWVKGESLVDWVAHNPQRDLLDSTRVIARLAAVVDYLHSGASTGTAVLHRDIKPANVLIDGTNVCLVDFGFARLMSGEPMTLAGTPYYLAPEIVGGGTFGEESDRYALGATAYYAIVGEPPTPGDYAGMRAKLTHARGAEGRVDLADHVLAMMAQDPAQRPANTIEWAQALAAGAVSTSLPTKVMPSAVVAAGVAATTTPAAKRKRHGKLIAVVAALVVLAAIAAGTAYALKGGGSKAPVSVVSPAPAASITPSLTPSAVSSGVSISAASPSASGFPSTEPSPSGSSAVSSAASAEGGLTLLNLAQLASPIDGSVNTGTYTMMTKPYFNSLGMQVSNWGGGVASASVAYNVPPGFNAFRATIGMDDGSGSTATTSFQIMDPVTGNYLFGGPGHLVTLKLNEVRNIALRLPTGILRIELVTNSQGSGNDWDVGIQPVWGNAELTGPASTAVLPTPAANQ
jgi:serine/threonine protein kinase